MNVLTVVGARPQFVKAAVVSQALRSAGLKESLVHTGQHFDDQMSGSFFSDLGLPDPDYNLGIHSLGHGAMTARMLEAIEGILLDRRPDWVLVYGDTNSTLAAALAASKLSIPIAHVEAGLRSYNLDMPEEVNRVLTDRISRLLFAPTPLAVLCLEKEGITEGVHEVGDVMMDAVVYFQERAVSSSTILAQHDLVPGSFYLATVHRASNTDAPDQLGAILRALSELDAPVVLPLHPRTRGRVAEFGLEGYLATSSLQVIAPASYLDMLVLEKQCRAVVTDSGGVQKEAYISGRPCFTLRTETEWQETVESGWNQLVEPADLSRAICDFTEPTVRPELYGSGQAAPLIVEVMQRWS